LVGFPLVSQVKIFAAFKVMENLIKCHYSVLFLSVLEEKPAQHGRNTCKLLDFGDDSTFNPSEYHNATYQTDRVGGN